jgi:nitrogen fixation protein FixH
VIAAQNRDPLVVDDAWLASERYNAALASLREGAPLGEALVLGVTENATGVRVRVALRDGAGPGRVAEVSVRRVRPAEGGFDASFPLELRGGGFEGEVPLPRPGRWRLEVRADVEGRAVQRTLLVERS